MLHARVPFVARTQQCFAVKAGIDGLLDIARRSFCDTSEGSKNAYLVKSQFFLLKEIILCPVCSWFFCLDEVLDQSNIIWY